MSNSEKLLTAEERDACQKVAASGAGLASQRATALLAINQGATRAQAFEQTGLTSGQIGYLLRAFRQKRLALFPDAESDEAQQPAKTAEPEKDKGKKKAKKLKKNKKAKTKKKAKKPKKGKKAKATKAERPKKDRAAKKKSKKK